MFAEVLKSVTIYDGVIAGQPDIGGWFPGALKLPSGELLVMFSTGTEFEGSLTVAISRSTDSGQTWNFEGPVFKNVEHEPGCLKPILLKNGKLVAIGYGFTPEMPLVNPATGGLAPGGNYVTFSDDGCKWSSPIKIETGHREVLETSGPCIELDNGDLLCVSTPFPMWNGELPSGRKGILLRSSDGGCSWQDSGVFFQSENGNISPYESRIVRLADGRIAIIIWCLDEASGKSLNNHVICSEDDAHSWSQPLDTGIPAQASNLFPLNDGTLLSIHCIREGKDIGLHLCHAAITGGQWQILDRMKIWSGAAASGRISSLAAMGDNLKFGQPSIIPLSGGNYLALHWAMTGKAGRILGHIFHLNTL